jgi:membrane protein DedA with SNARE-associated domain
VSGITTLHVGSLVSYLVAFGLPCFDAVLPVLPSETVIIAFGVASAGSSDMRIFLILLCAAAGAWAGDNLSYLIGWRFGPWATRRFFAGEKGTARRDWAERSLNRFGIGLIIVCRFIPGGRTAVTLSCGLIRYSWRRFAVATAVAAVIWASYAFFAGRLGGKAFQNMPVVGFAVAFGGVLVISGLVELIRRIIVWRKKERKEEPPEGAPQGEEPQGEEPPQEERTEQPKEPPPGA